MTEQQKAWYEVGKLMGEKSSDQHPEQIIQEDWNKGQSCNASYCYGGFNNWLKISKSWASGVRKGSKYFENN
jgi:hypothetical protein